MEKVDLTAKWIWCEDNKRKNDFVLFRKEFDGAAAFERGRLYRRGFALLA